MRTITRFEDLEIWRKTRLYSKEIFELATKNGFEKDFGLKNQMNDSAGSIADHIAEGSEKEGNKEFISF
jgi:four helix bundle protein